MAKKRKPFNPWRIIILLAVIAALVYVNQVVIPTIPPPFIPTPTPTRPPESFITDAQNLEAEGKFTQAIAAYQQAVQADPRNPANFIAMARLQMYIADYPGAATNASNALLLNNNNSMAHAIYGWALGLQGDYLNAEAALNTAIELDTNNAAAYAYLAEVITLEVAAGVDAIGAVDRAVDASRLAMTLNPNSLETNRGRGLVLEMTGNYAEAAAALEAAVAINPNIAVLHLALGRNYRFLEQYDKAVQEFTRANALNPSDPEPDLYISRTYFTIGEYAKAIQFAEQAVIDDPTDPYLRGNLGTMYYRNREYNKSLASLRLAVQGGLDENGNEIPGIPLDYGRPAEYYYTYGLSLAQQGECGEALQISQALIQIVPNDEYAAANADEIITMCRGIAPTLQSGSTPPGAPTEIPTVVMEPTPTP